MTAPPSATASAEQRRSGVSTPAAGPGPAEPTSRLSGLGAPGATAPRDASCLPVVETFHSLQGEGLHAGRSAFFIRLAGCSVGCSWCDTKPSWALEGHPRQSLADLAAEVAAAAAAGAAFVVITGGEPLEHALGPLCAALAAQVPALPLHLETSGAAPLRLSGQFDWITLSPKRHRPPGPELLAACDELKLVVHEAADLDFAEAMAAEALQARRIQAGRAGALDQQIQAAADMRLLRTTSAAPALLLQPGWNCRRGQELAIDFVRRHPAWRLSLQSHKWLGVR